MGVNIKQIRFFENKHVRIVLYPNFVIDGKIIDIGEDSILFETNQKISALSFDAIKQITEF